MSCRFLFSGDLTIGKFLVVLDDLRLDVVKGEVDVLPVLPDFYLLRFIANQVFFIAVCQKVILLPNLNFHYFWCRKLKSRVKLIDTYLISSVMPFFCQTAFLRRPLHIENTEWTLLCMESGLRAAFADLRFILSCSRLKSNGQCMLSINQWLRTNEPNAGVPVSRLLTYRRFSEVCTPDVFLTVSDSYAIIVILPPHFMNYEQWKQKSTLTTLGSTPYKITTFLNEQRNPK